jgi:hypothetical protein
MNSNETRRYVVVRSTWVQLRGAQHWHDPLPKCQQRLASQGPISKPSGNRNRELPKPAVSVQLRFLFSPHAASNPDQVRSRNGQQKFMRREHDAMCARYFANTLSNEAIISDI